MVMELATGSFVAWSKEGARMGAVGTGLAVPVVAFATAGTAVGAATTRGRRTALTSAKKPSASKVKAAPRRAWAVAGSGMAESWARVRW